MSKDGKKDLSPIGRLVARVASTGRFISASEMVEAGADAAALGPRAGTPYASAALAYSAPERQAAVLALEPLFKELPNALLTTIVEGVERAGPHVGNPDLPEEMLRVLARFEQHEREAAYIKREATSAKHWALVEKLVFLVIGAILGAVVKAWM